MLLMLLSALIREGKVRKTYPESLCCSNSREPCSEDGELHDEYRYRYLVLLVCWTWFRLID